MRSVARSVVYKSRLVPRGLSLIGIIGAPILVAGFIAVLFGFIGRLDPYAVLSAVPVALFELSLGVWLVVRGFNSGPVATPLQNLFKLAADIRPTTQEHSK